MHYVRRHIVELKFKSQCRASVLMLEKLLCCVNTGISQAHLCLQEKLH
jgi:hypothetical protein